MPRNNYKVHFDSQCGIRPFKGNMYNGDFPTLSQLFRISVHRFPQNKFLEGFSPRHLIYNYSEVYAFSASLAMLIRSKGYAKGDKIAVCGKNSVEWGIVYLGIVLSGCIAVPLDALLNDEEVGNLVRFAEIKMAFVDNDKLDNFKNQGVNDLYCLDETNELYILKFLQNYNTEDFTLPEQEQDDVAEILFTSGTTGTPKGVVLTHKNLVSDIFYTTASMLAYPTDCFYALLPIHHAYTMMAAFLIPMAFGSAVCFGKRIVAREIVRDLKVSKVTIFLGVPVLFNKFIDSLVDGIRKKGKIAYYFIIRLMRFSGFIRLMTGFNPGKVLFSFLTKKIGFDKMRICISGAGALPRKTVVLYRQLGVPFVEGYGMTETSPITTLNPLEGYKFGSVGRVFPELEYKIINKDKNGNGTFCIKGDVVMKSYYKMIAETSEILDEDGYLSTGDVGYVDKDGYFYITGRAKNIIVTDGGKNVFPEELEKLFVPYRKAVEQVIVAGYNQDGFEKVRAIIHPSAEVYSYFSSSADVDKEVYQKMLSIVARVNKKLQSYKKISLLQISKEPLETTTTNKFKRSAIIARMDKSEKV